MTTSQPQSTRRPPLSTIDKQRVSRGSRAAPLPHLYQPAEDRTQAELKTLFDLRKPPGYYNAAAKAALLRRSKQSPHDQCFCDFSGSNVRVEISAAGMPLLGGDWHWQATADGQRLSDAGPWKEICWHHDKNCDYLELELPLSHGWRIERQVLLARNDRFLLLSDALLGSEATPTELRFEQSWRIGVGASYLPAEETREGRLAAGSRRRTTVIPVCLPEWHAEFCHGRFIATDDGQLRLEQAVQGRSLFSPLWIDLDPNRARRPPTWRRLTVAENLHVVRRDVAAAFRVQSGRDQWLIYRSLAPAGNRSVLGHNTLHSFVCSRFLPGGEMEEIVAIE